MSWKQVGSNNDPGEQHRQVKATIFKEMLDFGSHFGSPADLEGAPQIDFLGIMLEKIEKRVVRERFLEKHEMFIEIRCQNGCPGR